MKSSPSNQRCDELLHRGLRGRLHFVQVFRFEIGVTP
jgi:hypothetical protein